MKSVTRMILATCASMLLASCGGGGGSDTDGGFTPPGISVSVTTASASTTPFSLVDVTVRVTGANGQALSANQSVKLQISPTSIGLVSTPTPLQGTPVISDFAETLLGGGVATFRFHSRNVGTATLTATTQDPNAAGRSVTATTTINVAAGPPNDRRITLVPNRTSLPPNTLAVPPFYGSPFIAEVIATQRLMSGETAPDGRTLGVSVAPINDGVGGFSQVDLGETPEVDEFTQRMSNGPVKTTGGRISIFVHSPRTLGQFTLNVTGQDPETLETISASQTFNVAQAATSLPTQVVAGSSYSVYLQGSGGETSVPTTAIVRDGNNAFVPDPVSGANKWNNIRFEIISTPLDSARLTAVNAQGLAVSGGVISVATTQGVGNVIFNSGTRTGVYVVKATADRADNNVDNGIQDGVSANFNVTVSDGRVFDIDITGPTTNAIVVNPPEVSPTSGTIPPLPDGTYTLTVSAIVTDREGNPALPGTEVRFGLIDSPQQEGVFSISGLDGNPVEGGTGFSAPTGSFQSAGGGAGPGDTLLVFGEDVVGNRDLESARRVTTVNSQTSLTTATRFNFNDDTGTSVNSGPVLPYIIGRAVDGNILVSAFTNANGVATTKMNYPVSKLGKVAMIWAQASGDVVSGTPEIVTDVEAVRFAGVAPARMSVSPTEVPANVTAPVRVCLTDALNAPITGVAVNFAFTDFQTGTGTIDGQTTTGTLADLTGEDGCVTANVQTSGVLPTGTSSGSGTTGPRVTFSAIGTSQSVKIVASGTFVIQVAPGSGFGDGSIDFTITLRDGNGNPMPNVVIVASCTATSPGNLVVSSPPGTTNVNGNTSARITGSGFLTSGTAPPTGTCRFTTGTGAPSATISWGGLDQCSLGISPPPVGCT